MIKTFPFKKPFLTGLITLLPVILCLVVISVILKFLVYQIGLPVGNMILSFLELVSAKNLSAFRENSVIATFTGVVTAGGVVVCIGYLVNNIIGRRLTESVEDGFFGRLPLVRTIYPYTKQIATFLGGKDRRKGFKRVVAVEYPKDGIYAIGFLTADSIKPLADLTGFDCVTVFIPSSPTPFTGYTVFVPREKILHLPISVNEALRLLVSGGVLIPDQPEQNSKMTKKEFVTIRNPSSRKGQLYPIPTKVEWVHNSRLV